MLDKRHQYAGCYEPTQAVKNFHHDPLSKPILKETTVTTNSGRSEAVKTLYFLNS